MNLIKSRPHNFKDLTGNKYGRLTVIKYLGSSYWECKCDCGKITKVFTGNLYKGTTKSCGCYAKDLLKERSKKHGLSYTKVYKVARDIIKRCTNPNCKSYKDYGGRGVTIFPLWKNDIGLFAKWLLKHGWYEGCEVDKDIKGGKGYYPDTITIVDRKENSQHKRNTIHFTYLGKTQSLRAWCVDLHLKYSTVWYRYKKLGWRDPKLLFSNVAYPKRRVNDVR